MANPYKKEQNARRVPPGGQRKEESMIEPTPVVEVSQEPITEDKATIENAGGVNLLAGLSETKPKAKSYSFYLDEPNVAKIQRMAKKNKCSVSKILNVLLANLPEN